VSTARDPEQIQEEIEQTRAELGDTVEALAQKADVKAQAKRKVQETKRSVADKKDKLLGKAGEVSPDGAVWVAARAPHRARANPLPPAALGAFALGFVVGRLSKR
jgi:ElaB/YqjD/DUF883 family membrane-anchored ribosome-binding protein